MHIQFWKEDVAKLNMSSDLIIKKSVSEKKPRKKAPREGSGVGLALG